MKNFFLAMGGVIFLFLGYLLLKNPSASSNNASATVPASTTPQVTMVPGAPPETAAQVIAMDNAQAQANADAHFAQLTASPASMLGETSPQNPVPLISGIAGFL